MMIDINLRVRVGGDNFHAAFFAFFTFIIKKSDSFHSISMLESKKDMKKFMAFSKSREECFHLAFILIGVFVY